MGSSIRAARAFGAEILRPPADPGSPKSEQPAPEPTAAEERQKVIRTAANTYRDQLMPWKVFAAALFAGVAVHNSGMGIRVLLLIPALAVACYVFVEWRLTWRHVRHRRGEIGDTGRKMRRISARAVRAARVGAGIGVWLTAVAATTPTGFAGRIVWVVGAFIWALTAYQGWWRDATDPAAPAPAARRPQTRDGWWDRTAVDENADTLEDEHPTIELPTRSATGGIPTPPPRAGRRPQRPAPAAPAHEPVKLPDEDILVRSASAAGQQPEMEPDLTEAIQTLLGQHQIRARVAYSKPGPSTTRYFIELEPGQKVRPIVGLTAELQLVCRTQELSVLAPVPGQPYVGVEVPNVHRETVTVGEILASPAARGNRHPLLVPIGKDADGVYYLEQLNKFPHILLAGSTGAGKSGYINSWLASLLTRATPDQVRMLLIDPKQVELTRYQGIPHLLFPVITRKRDAIAGLQWLTTEMEQRYDEMQAAGVQHIDQLNDKIRSGEYQLSAHVHRTLEPLPYLVAVVDELAELMIEDDEKEVETAIVRIGQLARACGIYLVLATQRPSVDVVTGLIKANIPTRLAVKTFSNTDSRVILDQPGAEKLLGAGDALYLPVGRTKPIRVQGPWVTEVETEKIIAYWKAHQGASDTLPQLDLADLPEVPAAPKADPVRARDIVLAAARRLAEGDGGIEKGALVAATPGLKDATRNAALTDLCTTGDLIRTGKGVYRVPADGEQQQPGTAAADDDD